MTTLNYFAYGSNMLTERLRRRVPSTQALGTGWVDGYEMRFAKRGNDGSAKCTMVSTSDARCHGVLFQIDAAERHILDTIEGVGVGYELVELDVVHHQLGPTESFCYIGQEAWIDHELDPFDWYHRLVILGAREHGLPKAYRDLIAEVPVRTDGDAPRRSEAEAIFAELLWLKK